MEVPLKRFVKKIPPSASSPAYKLTLPVQIVLSHLRHLIDTDFELASAPDAVHTWQGSIVPRRNKDRSEYTLQGWKLWAEAHDIQSGDQVSFELVSPRKMILTVIKQGLPPAKLVSGDRVRKTSDTADFPAPSKALRLEHDTSPAGSSHSDKVEETPLEAIAFDESIDPDGLDLMWNAFGDEMPAGLEELGSAPAADPLPEISQVGANLTPRASNALNMPLAGLNIQRTGLMPSSPESLIAESMTPNGTTHLPSRLADLSSCPNLQLLTARHQRPICPNSIQDFPPNENVLLRRNATVQSLFSSHSSAVEDYSEIYALNRDRFREVPASPRTPSRMQADVRATWERFQRKLDCESRKAMRAAMGLEKCIVQMSSNALADRDSQEEVFRHLSTLKANLWQMLVMSMSENLP